MSGTGKIDTRGSTPLPVALAATVGFCPIRLDRMDGAMQAEIAAGHYAGISVTVARHGKLVKSASYGYQSLEIGSPLREDAIFRIASMTKPIIAVAMLLLYEEGKWQLDDHVTKFIPEFADLKVMAKDGTLVPLDRPMIMRHLMASSAGFAFGPLVGTTNPKLDAIYAAAGLWSGTADDISPSWRSCRSNPSPARSFGMGFSRRSGARSFVGLQAKISTRSSTDAFLGLSA